MITSIDVQEQLISLLTADATIQTLFLSNPAAPAAPAFNAILNDDPVAIDQVTNCQLAVVLVQEGDEDATLGGYGGGGRDTVCLTFALMVYLFDNTRAAARKQLIQSITSQMRMAVMRYRQSIVGGQQLWYLTSWRKTGGGAVTSYFTDTGKRLSVTFLDVYINQPYV